jgi:predicted nucleic-acid-binding protein
LVRFLVQDDKTQAAAANQLFSKAKGQAGQAFFISLIVLCELVWVLEAGYKFKKTDIVNSLEQLLSTKQILVESTSSAWAALSLYRQHSKIDFADALIGLAAQRAGCPHTLTFDQGLRGVAHFRLVHS